MSISEKSDTTSVSCFTFTAGQGSLLKFFEASRTWLSALVDPPTREHFKIFLQGAHAEVATFTLNPVKKNFGKDKEHFLKTVDRQIRRIEQLMLQMDLPVVEDEAESLCSDHSGPSLEGWLETAAALSDFQSGRYEEDWGWICGFYEFGAEYLEEFETCS